ncbi:MAG: hypothetical protein K0Q79_227 [Flavipsychrobacter sp.]|jgi:predicted metal-dependent HD superfamily phosphohydrolase|nr:hypothetical protein [Flavipsychrobacter sp.]
MKKLKKELPRNLTYHSAGHIKDVYKSAKRLAKLEGIKGEDLLLLLTAVLFHDSGFLWQQYEHEKVSCEIVREYLPAYGYNEEQIERICGMILATKIPQSPKNHLEEIICDADLDYLGRDDFFRIGNGLYEELCMYGILNNEEDWNKLQAKFLEKHKYFTKSGKKLRKEKKLENIATVKSKLKKEPVN